MPLQPTAAIPDLDILDNKGLKDMANMLASQTGGMDPESVAYGAYAISALPSDAAMTARRLDAALLKQYRANLIGWMEHALMMRAGLGGGGPTIKKIEAGLAKFVEAMPKALKKGAAPSIDEFIPQSGYLEAVRVQPVANKIFNVIATAAAEAGAGAPTSGGTPIPFNLVWNNRWEIPSDKRTYGYRNDLKRMGFKWDTGSTQWYLPRIGRNGLPPGVSQRFQNTAQAGSGLTIDDWYFNVWLPANIGRFTKVFTDYVRDKQSSYKMLFSVAGDKVKVKFKRKIDNARDAVEELRYRYTNRSGREPWLEVMDRFVDLVGTTSPNKIRPLIDRINNLQHSNGLFMEHFPGGVKSWHDRFLNAKYSAPTGGHLARYIPDSDLRDYLTHMNVYGLQGGFGVRGPTIEQRSLRYQPPGNYHTMKKLLEGEEDKVNWRAKGYPKYKGTVQLDRFAPKVQRGLDILEDLAHNREKLLDLRITTEEGYRDWSEEVHALEEQQRNTTADLLSDLKAQDRIESREDPLWWVDEQQRSHARSMQLTKWMQINFPQEFIEKFPYSVPGVSQSKLAPFVSRYASPRRVAKKWKKLPKGWTNKSVEKFWDTLTGTTPEHKVWDCVEKMTKPFGDGAGAFCGGLADWQMPGWREKNKKESPDARSNAKSYWKGKMKKKKSSSPGQFSWGPFMTDHDEDVEEMEDESTEETMPSRVALKFAGRKAPPMEMGSAVMLKRQGLTPVDIYFGEARPHRRPIIGFRDSVQDRRGKVFFFVGIAEGGLAILADTERQAKHRRRQLIEDRKHYSTAARVAARYLKSSLASDLKTISGVYGRVHDRSSIIAKDWWQIAGKSRGNRHRTSEGVAVTKKKPAEESGSYNNPDLVGGSSHRTLLSAAEASKKVKGYSTYFGEALGLVDAGVVVGPKTLRAIRDLAEWLESGADDRDPTTKKLHKDFWTAYWADASGGKLLSPRFYYKYNHTSGYGRSF